MIGEQQHRIHKQHAPHTNGKDTELQLLKRINLFQAIRFVMVGVHRGDAGADEVEEVINQCVTLKTKFLGAILGENSLEKEPNPLKLAVSVLIPRKLIKPRLRDFDEKKAEEAFMRYYNVSLAIVGRYTIRYFKKLTIKEQMRGKNWLYKLSLLVGAPVKTRVGLVFVRRIWQIEVERIVKVFISAIPLVRKQAKELFFAGYEVWECEGGELVVSTDDIVHEQIHFVSRGKNSWWLNPFTTHFI